jgi:hypothetical protein
MYPSSDALSPAQLAAVRTAIGTDRLAGYDTAVGEDPARALHLYGWNAAVSAALFEDLSVQRVLQGGKPETEGRVVAELMFGFWRLLHSKTHEATLWTPCLRHAYPSQRPNDRSAVYTRLDRLRAYPDRDVRLGWSRVEWGKDARAKAWRSHVEPEDAAPRRPSAASRRADLEG